MRRLGQVLADMAELMALSASGSGAELAALAEGLPRAPKLVELALALYPSGEPAATASIATALGQCQSLASVRVLSGSDDAQLDDGPQAAVQALAEVHRAPSLLEVGLYGVPLRPADLQALALALPRCAKLHTLDLCRASLHDDVLERMVRNVLAHCSRLELLWLSGNGMGQSGVRCLQRTLAACCPKVWFLELSDNQLEDAPCDVVDLARQLPQLRMISCWEQLDDRHAGILQGLLHRNNEYHAVRQRVLLWQLASRHVKLRPRLPAELVEYICSEFVGSLP